MATRGRHGAMAGLLFVCGIGYLVAAVLQKSNSYSKRGLWFRIFKIYIYIFLPRMSHDCTAASTKFSTAVDLLFNIDTVTAVDVAYLC